MTELPDAVVERPDRIFYGGTVLTVDDEFTVAEAVAVRNGRFIAVGTDSEIRALAGAETDEIDLDGRTVVPGLIDSHLHLRQVGVDLDRVTLFDARSIDDVLNSISEAAAETPDGEWVLAGWGWHESQLEEGKLPNRWQLDDVAPDNPVFIPRGGHVAALNTRALERADIDADTPDPDGGTIVRDPDSGEPNGILLETARKQLAEPVLPDRGYDEFVEDIKRAVDELNSLGVTAALEPGLEREELRAFQQVWREDELTVRTDALVRVYELADVEEASRFFYRDFGDDRLKIGGSKYMIDGGVEGGRLNEPYEVVDGVQEQEEYYGHFIFPPGGEEELREMARTLADLGHQLQTHAVGDAAMELLIDIYEEADDVASIDELRWIFMHVFLPPEEVRDRLDELGVACTVQNHPTYLGQNMVNLWGRDRAERSIPIRTLLDEGHRVGGGTDAPVVPWFPFESIWWMVTRDTVTAGVLGEDQAITREEALRLWTIESAYTMAWEDEIGSIEPGKRADLVALDTDYLDCPAEALRDIEVELTVVGGEIVHDRTG